MLAFIYILVLAAPFSLAKPTGNCIFLCDQPGMSSSYVQPQSFSQPAFSAQPVYGQPAFGQQPAFSQPTFNHQPVYRQPLYKSSGPGIGMLGGNIETLDTGTVPVQPVNTGFSGFPAHQAQPGNTITAGQPGSESSFFHHSSSSNMLTSAGYHKVLPSPTIIHQQPPVVIQQEPMRQPQRIGCLQSYTDPCVY